MYGSCSRNSIRRSLREVTFPESGDSFPARIFSRLVLPEPFRAMSAIFSPLAIPKLMSSNSGLSLYDLLIFSTDNIFINYHSTFLTDELIGSILEQHVECGE